MNTDQALTIDGDGNTGNRLVGEVRRYIKASGLPVYGPHANLPGTWPTTRAVNGGYLPAASRDGGYPVLRRYTDARHLPPMSEPTVAEIARIGVSLALLRDGGPMSPPAAAPTNQQ